MTLLTSVGYCACGAAELAVNRRLAARRRGGDHAQVKSAESCESDDGGSGVNGGVGGDRLARYAALSVLTFAGLSFTNWSLGYVDYTTRIVGKSCKVLPVMAFSAALLRRRYSALAWLGAALLAGGVSAFSAGDAALNPRWHPLGLALIAVAVALDAATCVFEERFLFRVPYPACHAEILCYTSAFSVAFGLAAVAVSGELRPALAHSLAHPHVPAQILAYSVLGYLSVAAILLLIRHFSATDAEIVKSVRKVCSISLSFVFYRKRVNAAYALGFGCVAASLLLVYFDKERRFRARKSLAENGKAQRCHDGRLAQAEPASCEGGGGGRRASLSAV